MSSNSTAFLHAELLLNIRQLTLYVSLPDYPDQSSPDLDRPSPATISLSETRRAVTVSYSQNTANTLDAEDCIETIKLPARVSQASRNNLKLEGHQLPSQDDTQHGRRKEFSFRLQLDPEEANDAYGIKESDDDFIPWLAEDMMSCKKLVCRFCSRQILDQDKVLCEQQTSNGNQKGYLWKWKNMPSGNWAEMMDFWHCHKPDSHDREEKQAIDEQNAAVKGYGAANQVLVTPGTILVDVASFLVSDEDCLGIKKSNGNEPCSTSSITHPSSKPIFECPGCGSTLGMYDVTTHGWRIYKANVGVMRQTISTTTTTTTENTGSERRRPPYEPEYQSTETIVSAQLLEFIQREGIRRFILHSGEETGFLLWIFNPDLRYSSASATHSITSQRALKVFYQSISDVEAILEPETGQPAPIAVEELFLPQNILDETMTALRESNQLLPRIASMFKEWNVGFLSRFDKGRA